MRQVQKHKRDRLVDNRLARTAGQGTRVRVTYSGSAHGGDELQNGNAGHGGVDHAQTTEEEVVESTTGGLALLW